MQKVIETHCLYLYTCPGTSRGWNFYHHFYKFGERMNFMKCHFKEWMWVAITIQPGFLVDAMASFVRPEWEKLLTPRRTRLVWDAHAYTFMSVHCAVEERRRRENFPKRKTLLEHVNFKTTFHVHFSFESFSYFREKLFFKNWRDGKTNFLARSGTEIFWENVAAGTRVGAMDTGGSGKPELLFRKGFSVFAKTM